MGELTCRGSDWILLKAKANQFMVCILLGGGGGGNVAKITVRQHFT